MAALTQTEYSFKGDRLILEPKELIKRKIGYSPDEADAIACTFAFPVGAPQRQVRAKKIQIDYDPFQELR